MKMIVITSSGNISIQENNGYQCLKKAVGGYVEAVHIGDDAVMYLNEEGKLLGLDVNPIATKLYRSFISTSDVIVGDVCIVGTDGGEEDIDVSLAYFEKAQKIKDHSDILKELKSNKS